MHTGSLRIAFGLSVLAFSSPATAQEPEAVSPPAPQPNAATIAEPALPASATLERLIKALGEDDAYKVRLQAAVILGRTGDERVVKPLIDALSADPHYTVRAAAATALANLRALKAVSQIIRRLAVDTEELVREEARRALQKFPREEALPYVVATCSANDPRVRKQALSYLAAEPTPGAEQVFAKALGDDNPEIASIAQGALKKLPAAELVRLLEGAVDHREPAVRRGGVDMLRSLDTPEATQLVLRVYSRDIEEEEVRVSARTALRELKRHLPMGQIVKDATQSPEKHTRAQSLRLLGVLGGNQAEAVLLGALGDDDIYVRGTAVMAMGELGDPKVVPSLERLADDPANQRIAHLVRHALKQLRKKNQ
jgi:HEAT repeat protein